MPDDDLPPGLPASLLAAGAQRSGGPRAQARPVASGDRRRGRRRRRPRGPGGRLDEARGRRARLQADVAVPLRRLQGGAAGADDRPGRLRPATARARRDLARGAGTLGAPLPRRAARAPVGGARAHQRPAADPQPAALAGGRAAQPARHAAGRPGEAVGRPAGERLRAQRRVTAGRPRGRGYARRRPRRPGHARLRPARRPPDRPRGVPPRARGRRHRRAGRRRRPAVEFEFGLRRVLDGIELLVQERSAGSTRSP